MLSVKSSPVAYDTARFNAILRVFDVIVEIIRMILRTHT